MKVLLSGGRGQLGHDLSELLQKQDLELDAPDSGQMDLLVADSVSDYVFRSRPDWVVNCAAYTAVDKAESEPETAFRINRDGAAFLAQAAQSVGARMMQVSTDFVFSGESQKPYSENDSPAPLSVYGRSKLEGEQAVKVNCPNSQIVRTSWLYGAHGHNFVKTILRLADSREELGIVNDQRGTPTWSRDLAQALWLLMNSKETGTFHYSNEGAATWYEFAVAIVEEARALGYSLKVKSIKPISTEEYPTPAKRPAYSVFSKERIVALLPTAIPGWRDSLRAMLQELQHCPDC